MTIGQKMDQVAADVKQALPGTKEYNMTHTLAGGMTGAHGGSVGSTAGGNVGKTDYTTGNQGSLKQKIKEKIPGTTEHRVENESGANTAIGGAGPTGQTGQAGGLNEQVKRHVPGTVEHKLTH